jgi:hypothetical protein
MRNGRIRGARRAERAPSRKPWKRDKRKNSRERRKWKEAKGNDGGEERARSKGKNREGKKQMNGGKMYSGCELQVAYRVRAALAMRRDAAEREMRPSAPCIDTPNENV